MVFMWRFKFVLGQCTRTCEFLGQCVIVHVNFVQLLVSFRMLAGLQTGLTGSFGTVYSYMGIFGTVCSRTWEFFSNLCFYVECWQVCRQVSRTVLGQCTRTWEFFWTVYNRSYDFFPTYALMWNVDRSADRSPGQFALFSRKISALRYTSSPDFKNISALKNMYTVTRSLATVF